EAGRHPDRRGRDGRAGVRVPVERVEGSARSAGERPRAPRGLAARADHEGLHRPVGRRPRRGRQGATEAQVLRDVRQSVVDRRQSTADSRKLTAYSSWMAIHATAIVSKKADLAQDVDVGPYAIIGDDVELHARVTVGSHAVLKGPMVVGEG